LAGGSHISRAAAVTDGYTLALVVSAAILVVAGGVGLGTLPSLRSVGVRQTQPEAAGSDEDDDELMGDDCPPVAEPV
jgi:hypothetical protein